MESMGCEDVLCPPHCVTGVLLPGGLVYLIQGLACGVVDLYLCITVVSN
jgi:hypothetical protein